MPRTYMGDHLKILGAGCASQCVRAKHWVTKTKWLEYYTGYLATANM